MQNCSLSALVSVGLSRMIGLQDLYDTRISQCGGITQVLPAEKSSVSWEFPGANREEDRRRYGYGYRFLFRDIDIYDMDRHIDVEKIDI